MLTFMRRINSTINLIYKKIHISAKHYVVSYTESYIHKVVLYQYLFQSNSLYNETNVEDFNMFSTFLRKMYIGKLKNRTLNDEH